MTCAPKCENFGETAPRLTAALALLIALVSCARTPAAPLEKLPMRSQVTSQAVLLDDVEFQTIADANWQIPPADASSNVELQLQITNRSQAPLRFNLFDTVRIALTSPEGVALLYDGGRNRVAGPEAVSPPIGPGESLSIVRRGQLKWVGKGDVLRLIGSDDFRGIWYFDGLTPGKYKLSFQYDNSRKTANDKDRVWIGKVATKSLEIQIISKENG